MQGIHFQAGIISQGPFVGAQRSSACFQGSVLQIGLSGLFYVQITGLTLDLERQRSKHGFYLSNLNGVAGGNGQTLQRTESTERLTIVGFRGRNLSVNIRTEWHGLNIPPLSQRHQDHSVT